MICKSCGSTIPSSLLERESFSCPNCGASYRRSSGKSAKTPPVPPKSKSAEAPRRSAPTREKAPTRQPAWLVYALAALLIIAVVACVLLLVRGNGRRNVSGVLTFGKIAVNETESMTVQIPEQKDTNYIVEVNSNQIGVVWAISAKKSGSFDLYVRNVYTKERNPSITWALIPIQPSPQQ